jgi:hypothetical protein
MNFLVPLYLAGALAVAIPIYLHLRRRPPRDSVDFSSLMFLEPTKHQPIKRQSQLENLPLLILRCLALLLLAAMFARPFMPGGDSEGGEGRMRTVILLDTSASMQREGLWEEASERTKEVISTIKGEGAVAIITVDRTPRIVTSFGDWESADVAQRKEIAKAAVETLKPSWQGSNLGAGLIAAAEMVADASADDEAPRPARIVVISDLQSGAALDAVADASWPSNLEVELAPIEAREVTNVTIAVAASTVPDKPAVRLRNDPASEESRFRLKVGDQTIAAVVPAGESRVFQLEEPISEVSVTGDQHDFDNRLFLAPREPALVKLLFLGDDKPDDSNGPEYYYRRALALSKVMHPRFVESLDDDPALLAIARPLTGTEIKAVRRTLQEGRDAILLITSTTMDRTLAGLAGMPATPTLRDHNHDRRYALLEEIDFEHPALREFRDPRWRDFTEVHFWKYHILEESVLPESATIVARFDTGDPAWIAIPVGQGSLLVMMSGWHPRDSQLSLSSKFIPLLFSIYSDHGPQVTGARQFFVGDPLPIENDEDKLTLPTGKTESLDPAEPYRPEHPGIYRVSNGERHRSFAVNLRPSESELTPLGSEPLAALGVPIDRKTAPNTAVSADSKWKLRNSEAESRQNLWRWSVVVLLAMLVAEAWLATRTGGTATQPEGAVT